MSFMKHGYGALQLHDNERLNEEDDLKEENKDNDMWQVEIMAHLKADNGKAFTLQELIFKLQNLMADKELGDHVFLEGMEYEGHECEGNGIILTGFLCFMSAAGVESHQMGRYDRSGS